jgi:DNA segregation ATPase FtsK/SpoIIIE-like protein
LEHLRYDTGVSEIFKKEETRMAGSGQSKRSGKQNNRVDPKIAPSRVSNVVGSVGSQSARSDQATNKQGSRRQEQSSPKRAQGKKQRAKKNPSPHANRPASMSPPSPGSTADSRVIAKVRDALGNMPPHHQQRLLGIILLLLALFLFAALTVSHSVPVFSSFHGAFIALFGWSAYLFSIGLIAFAVAHLIEGVQNKKLIRWSMVVGLVALWLLLLVESQLLLGGTTGGFLGALLVRPLLGWPPVAGHVLLIGLFAIFTIVTFQITLGHFMYIVRAFRGIGKTGQRSASSTNKSGPSPFLGQRPRFSRYSNGNSPSMPANAQQASTPPAAEEEEDEHDIIEFEADFGNDDDPLNDINIHKQQISRIPRGPRPALPPSPTPHNGVIQNVNQQPLPFNQAAGKNAEQKYPTMEPLAPNPLQKNKAHSHAEAAIIGSPWKLPETTILNNPEDVKLQMLGDDTSTLAKTIQDTLRSFRVEAEVKQEDISIGPTVIRFGIRPTGKPELKQDAQGKYVPVRDAGGNIVYESRTRVSRIMALQNDLALVLEAKSIRMEAPVPGRPYVGVEIPNKNSRLVTLREVLETKEYQSAKAKSKLAIALGKDVAGAVRVGDLTRMPHLLIAGATGSGKSVCINTIIASILTQATPDDVRLLMVDPKMVELNMYSGIPHLLLPVVTEVEKVVSLLKNAISEMEKRYRLFSQLGVRNLDGYRKLRAEKISRGDTTMKNLPAIVVIIDELADLMMAAPEEIEGMICRLAQLARATGIHLVVATQRPSVDVITGLIKANIPTRISFMVSSMVDSRTIIDMGGAERLLGRGDMLYLPADAGRPERIQGSFVADDEAEKLIAYWRLQAMEHMNATHNSSNQNPAAIPQPIEPGWEIKEHVSDDFELEDDLLERAEEVVREYERASISLLQRRLRIGYSRAARLIDLLEERGIIGQPESGGRSREVFEGNNGTERRGNGGSEGRTVADEAADIIAEEKARQEFLKKQGLTDNSPTHDHDET